MCAPWPAKTIGASAMRDLARRAPGARYRPGRRARRARLRSRRPPRCAWCGRSGRPAGTRSRSRRPARGPARGAARRYRRWRAARLPCPARGPRYWSLASTWMWRIMSDAAIGAGGCAASGTAARRRKGAAMRSSGVNMALLKERRQGWQAIRRGARSAPSSRALAISAWACWTCIASIIRPSWRSAPPVAASTSRRAASSSASVGLKMRLTVSIWLGWMSDLPSKPQARPSSHSAARPSSASSLL